MKTDNYDYDLIVCHNVTVIVSVYYFIHDCYLSVN